MNCKGFATLIVLISVALFCGIAAAVANKYANKCSPDEPEMYEVSYAFPEEE